MIVKLAFPKRSLSTKEKTFGVEAYFASKSRKLVQETFCCSHAPRKSWISGKMWKIKQHMCAQSLTSEDQRNTENERVQTMNAMLRS